MYETTFNADGDYTITLSADMTREEFLALGPVITDAKAQSLALKARLSETIH